jgi:hypothetical protein
MKKEGIPTGNSGYRVMKALLNQKSKEELNNLQQGINKRFNDASYGHRKKLAILSVLIDEVISAKS